MIKKLALLLALLSAPLLAQTPPTTPNLGLNLPVIGQNVNSWGGYLNANSTLLDNFLSGTSPLPALNITGNVAVGGNLVVTGTITDTAGSFLTGVVSGQGISLTGTSVGLIPCSITNQVLQWNGTSWGCATISGGSGPVLQVNGTPNGSQTLLNLAGSANITVTDGGSGTVTLTVPSIGTGNVSTTPSAAQVIAQPVGTAFGTNNENSVRWVPAAGSTPTSGGANWSQTIVSTLTGGTPATITLAPCPLGIFGTDSTSYVSIPTGGTAEFAKLTGGGSCVPGAGSGTITLVPANNHTNPYTIGTASSGIQETVIDAETNGVNSIRGNWQVKLQPTNPPQSVKYAVNARVTIASNAAWDFDGTGSNVDCEAIGDACFYLSGINAEGLFHGFRYATATSSAGALISQTACSSNVSTITTTLNPPVGWFVYVKFTDNTHFWGIHQVTSSSGTQWTFADNNCSYAGSPGGGSIAVASTPGENALEHAFLEDNGNAVTMRDLWNDSPAWATGVFNTQIVIDLDQDAIIEDSIFTKMSCTSAWCGAAISAQGGQNLFPLLTVKHAQITPGCAGNGIEYFAGQRLVIDDSVIQGFGQFSTWAGPIRGSSAETIIDNTYNEVGTCSNPIYTDAGLTGLAAFGMTGLMQYSTPAHIRANATGVSPSTLGQEPQFSTGGATFYEYWAVVCDNSNCSIPMRFGQANPTSSTPYTIGWPRVPPQAAGDTITYQILKTIGTGTGITYPVGTGNFAISSTAFPQCSTFLCTATDSTSTTLQSYAVPFNPGWNPVLYFWPGSVVLSHAANLFLDAGMPVTTVSGIVPTTNAPCNITALKQDGASPGLNICTAANVDTVVNGVNTSYGGRIVSEGPCCTSTMAGGMKGALIFQPPLVEPRLNRTDVITINDCNAAKTIGDQGKRPTADACDVALGLDNIPSANSANAGLSIRAPGPINFYNNKLPDGSSEGVQFSASGATFQSPVRMVQGMTLLGSTGGTAFPWPLAGTQVSDNFTRANSGTLGANWTAVDGTCSIVNNQAQITIGGSTRGFCAYTGSSFSNNQFVIVQVPITTTGSYGAALRMSSVADTAYFLQCNSSVAFNILKYVAGTGTAITTSSNACAPGDYLFFSVNGAALTASDITQGFTITGSDSSIASGSAGIIAANLSGQTFANFSAGDITIATNYKTTVNAPFTASSLIAGGAAPVLTGTGACATITAQHGAWAGDVTCTGTTGASTLVITTGTAAPNGTFCSGSDATAATSLSQSVPLSATACTLKGTVTANDVVTFKAVQY